MLSLSTVSWRGQGLHTGRCPRTSQGSPVQQQSQERGRGWSRQHPAKRWVDSHMALDRHGRASWSRVWRTSAVLGVFLSRGAQRCRPCQACPGLWGAPMPALQPSLVEVSTLRNPFNPDPSLFPRLPCGQAAFQTNKSQPGQARVGGRAHLPFLPLPGDSAVHTCPWREVLARKQTPRSMGPSLLGDTAWPPGPLAPGHS